MPLAGKWPTLRSTSLKTGPRFASRRRTRPRAFVLYSRGTHRHRHVRYFLVFIPLLFFVLPCTLHHHHDHHCHRHHHRHHHACCRQCQLLLSSSKIPALNRGVKVRASARGVSSALSAILSIRYEALPLIMLSSTVTHSHSPPYYEALSLILLSLTVAHSYSQHLLRYVQLLVEHYLVGYCRTELAYLVEGFFDVLPPTVLRGSGADALTSVELELIVTGLPDINVDAWRANTLPGDLNKLQHTRLSEWFWEVVEEMTADERAMLLAFACGTGRCVISLMICSPSVASLALPSPFCASSVRLLRALPCT